MIKTLISIVFALVTIMAQAQPCVPLPVDTVDLEAVCDFIPLVPPATTGVPITKCVVIEPNPGLLLFGYVLIQSPSCGPIAYTYLNYELYDADCNNLLASGQIVPVPNNVGLVVPDPAPSYIVCFTWMPLCEQTAMCPTAVFSPLPVELISFRSADAQGAIALQWKTASEFNSDRFEVQRSPDLQRWLTIGGLPAAGNSQTVREYVLLDHEPIQGVNYYRLLQFDLDHQFAMLRVIAVGFDEYGGVQPLRHWTILGQEK